MVEDATAAPLEAAIDEGAQEEIEEDEEEKEVESTCKCTKGCRKGGRGRPCPCQKAGNKCSSSCSCLACLNK